MAVAPGSMTRGRLNMRLYTIDEDTACALHGADVEKLSGYLDLTLNLDDEDRQILFVLDRAAWLRQSAAMLLAEADACTKRPGKRLAAATPKPTPARLKRPSGRLNGATNGVNHR